MLKEMTLDAALDAYYETKHGKYAANSWRNIYERLEHWRKWINKQVDAGPRGVYLTTLVGFDVRYMERYFNTLLPPRCVPGTYNLFRHILNGFWRFCRSEGWIDVDPMRHIEALRVVRSPKLILSVEELDMLLEKTEEPRDVIALVIGMNTGLRAGDVAALKVSQVDLATDTLRAWVEKTDEWRDIPISLELHNALVTWMAHYATSTGIGRPEWLPGDWTLVPAIRHVWNKPGHPEQGYERRYNVMSKMTAPHVIVRDALERIGHAGGQAGFHVLRRSAARALYDLAVADGEADPITRPQELLGHSSRRMTEVYIDRSHEKQQLDNMLRGKSFLGRAKATGSPKSGRRFRSA